MRPIVFSAVVAAVVFIVHPSQAQDAAAGKSGVKWDEPTLTKYLHDPKAMVKGTKMTFPGLKTDEDVANVIAYLKQFSN